MRLRFQDAGFTLIEVLLAAVILAIVGTETFRALDATFKTQRTVAHATELQELGTAILWKVREDLTQTFQVESPRPLTFFRGEDQSDRDRVEFTTLSHVPSSVDAPESDQTEVTYICESNSGGTPLNSIKRRETLWIDGQPDTAGDFITLADNVVAFNLEYSDGEKFLPKWDIRSADQLNKLPKLVRVSLKLRDDREREEVFETLIDLPMSAALGVTRQTASGGGAGGGGSGGTGGTGAPGQPGTQGQPGFSGQPGTSGQPGSSGQPGGFGQPRPNRPRSGGSGSGRGP